jgi:hypothetical protein
MPRARLTALRTGTDGLASASRTRTVFTRRRRIVLVVRWNPTRTTRLMTSPWEDGDFECTFETQSEDEIGTSSDCGRYTVVV